MPPAAPAHHAVPLDVLDGARETREAVRRVVGDLVRNLLLAAREQRHLVALLHQLAGQVQADEAGAAWGGRYITEGS